MKTSRRSFSTCQSWLWEREGKQEKKKKVGGQWKRSGRGRRAVGASHKLAFRQSDEGGGRIYLEGRLEKTFLGRLSHARPCLPVLRH